MDVQGVPLSTTCNMDVQGVSLSTASSMDVQGVTLSTASSMDVQGVYSEAGGYLQSKNIPLPLAQRKYHYDISQFFHTT
jgi:hypothetical protein